MEFLQEELVKATSLVRQLKAVNEAYRDLPDFDLTDQIQQAERLLGLLQEAAKEVENLPDLSLDG